MGEIGILNVGSGDTKLVFDNTDPAETSRAARIVKDMLRRGYALLVEVTQPDGSQAFQRAIDFDESKCEYLIADFDPSSDAAPKDERDEETSETPTASAPTPAAAETADPPRRRGRPARRVPASSTRAVAVARSAGG